MRDRFLQQIVAGSVAAEVKEPLPVGEEQRGQALGRSQLAK